MTYFDFGSQNKCNNQIPPPPFFYEDHCQKRQKIRISKTDKQLRTATPDYYSNSMSQRKSLYCGACFRNITLSRDYFQSLQTQLAEKNVIQVQNSVYLLFGQRQKRGNIILYKDIYFLYCLTSSTLTFSVFLLFDETDNDRELSLMHQVFFLFVQYTLNHKSSLNEIHRSQETFIFSF